MWGLREGGKSGTESLRQLSFNYIFLNLFAFKEFGLLRAFNCMKEGACDEKTWKGRQGCFVLGLRCLLT